MQRLQFIKSLLGLVTLPHLLKGQIKNSMKPKNQVQLVRHATILIQMGDKKILVDPMLAAKNEMEPVANSGNEIRIPMVDLPLDNQELAKLLKDVDAVFITHTHRDHWDIAAQKLISKDKLIFCQPMDASKIREQGFINVTPIQTEIAWEGLQINRTQGKHGTGEIGKKMGEVSGFVFKNGNHTLYVAGDTIWCSDVEDALYRFNPDTTIVNAGGARFLTGDPITMTPEDIMRVHESLPSTSIIAVHMDVVNHCLIKRDDLKKFCQEKGLISKVRIPIDGEQIYL